MGLVEGWREGPFVALDFETANHSRASACAVGLAWWDGQNLTSEHHLIRVEGRFEFTHIHGLTPADVVHSPAFNDVWGGIAVRLGTVSFLAAHNSGFDQSVLRASCLACGLVPPVEPFLCTMRLARSVWGIRPTRLPDVCRRLGIPLQHHDAASDARAAARIVLAARESWRRADY